MSRHLPRYMIHLSFPLIMQKTSTLTFKALFPCCLLSLFLLSACGEAPTAPEEEDIVFFAHGETPPAPKRLAARTIDESVVELTWQIASPYTEEIQIKKEQYLTDERGHPCSLELTELLRIDGENTAYRDSLDMSKGDFVRYTFSSVYRNIVSVKERQIEAYGSR